MAIVINARPESPEINMAVCQEVWASVPEDDEFNVSFFNSLLFMAVMYAERHGVDFDDAELLPYAENMAES